MVTTGDPDIETVDLAGLRSYLGQTAVVFALLFGSYARETASASSDVDLALQFPDDLDARERFRHRNRIDADVQAYADGFVDVSDIERLPTEVQYAAVRDGILLVGDEATVDAYCEQITDEYEETASDRQRERQEFIDCIASGDV
ncbi:type VII toxin-antitoxin system MntA family adenylyltransferase antitoxin [Halomicrococcus sp. SG-WS-1]|uniref:type VII toxin-antitoxin system MntA family adenylyltransferase antitoxin n=1 Tax=Halomicrococcus sp. SG-WS-1 TaxID=3439057 RepID=UPI003F7ABE3A